MKLSVAEKKCPAVGDFIITAIVLILALGIILLLPKSTDEALLCVISVDGSIIGEYELGNIVGTKTVTIESCDYPVTVELENNRVRISGSECPGGDCVACSWADRSGEQIICLPNRLIISLCGGTQQTDIDAVTGG